MRTESELLDLAESISRNDDRMSTEDYQTLYSIATDAGEIEDENKKLRDLAVLNWGWAHSCCGSTCKLQTDGCGYGIDRECNYEREIYDRMRELGIEVRA